jgi:ABC-type Fe3+-hydroxamate transport system substrate-binding protein
MNIAVINLWPTWGNCVLCGVDTLLGYSAPMYEGKTVDPEKTDEWAGQVICISCHNKPNKAEEEMKELDDEISD